jgi:hypothetical protein
MDEAAVLVVLSVLAAGMASLTAVAVRWAAFTTTSFRASVVQFVLLMMAAMFTGILAYFAIGGTPGIVAGFWVAGALMSASVVFVALSFARERVGTADSTTAPVALLKRTRFVASVIVLVLTNEFLMGWSFSLLSGGLPVGLGPGGDRLGTILAGAVVSPWFVFPMALEMALTLRWLWGAVPSAMRRYLLIQPLAMVCSPPTIAGLAWAVGTAAGASALMAGAIAFLLLSLFRGQELPARVFAFAGRLIATFGVMAVGLYAWTVYGNAELFAVSLLLQMVLFLHASTHPSYYTEASNPSGVAPVNSTPSAGSSHASATSPGHDAGGSNQRPL